MELKIDKEFKELLPALREEERKGLEEDIKEHGVREAIDIWDGYIVDGHNRYEICQANNIPFKTNEVHFQNRDEAKVWIIKRQFNRRNLSDFDRNRIALMYEDMIAKQMKQRQGERNDLKHSDQLVKKLKPRTTRKELANIAGTSEGSIQRTKLILEKGTPEQIKRAEKGGKESDGRSNTINAISMEIRNKSDGESGEKLYKCCRCNKMFPASQFYFHKNGKRFYRCKECEKQLSREKSFKDFKGNIIKSEKISMTEEQLKDYLYNQEKEINYTMEDFLEEMKSNGEKGIQTIETTIIIHKDLLDNEENKQKAIELLKALSDRLNQLNQLIKE